MREQQSECDSEGVREQQREGDSEGVRDHVRKKYQVLPAYTCSCSRAGKPGNEAVHSHCSETCESQSVQCLYWPSWSWKKIYIFAGSYDKIKDESTLGHMFPSHAITHMVPRTTSMSLIRLFKIWSTIRRKMSSVKSSSLMYAEPSSF